MLLIWQNLELRTRHRKPCNFGQQEDGLPIPEREGRLLAMVGGLNRSQQTNFTRDLVQFFEPKGPWSAGVIRTAIKAVADSDEWRNVVELLMKVSWEEVVAIEPAVAGQPEPPASMGIVEVVRGHREQGGGPAEDHQQPVAGGGLQTYTKAPCTSCNLPYCELLHTSDCWWGERIPCPYCKEIVGVFGVNKGV